MESLIKLSKKLTEHLLTGKKGKLGKEYFFMFSVSKFILLKESLLKKGTEQLSENEEVTVFYFDNSKNQKYVPVIMELYDYIKKNGSFTIKQGERVSLTKSTPDKNKLGCALWVMNKVRDSIAHGKYSFDFANDEILINNDNPNNGYSLKCSIPLVLLNKVSFFIEEIKDTKEDEKELLIRYYKYLQELSGIYEFDPKLVYNNYKYNNYNMNLLELEKLKYNDNKLELNNIYSNNYNINNYYNDKMNYSYDPNYSQPRSSGKDKNSKYSKLTPEVIQKYISEMNLRELDSLIKLLIKYQPKNDSEAEIIQRILAEYKFIVSHKVQLEKELDEYDKKTRKLIEEMHSILGIKNKNRIVDSIPALYNYMCLSFSLESNINYQYMSTEGLNISFDENYKTIINGIIRKCEEFNNSLKNQIEQYNNHSSEQFRHSLMDKIAEFYTDIISKYNVRNKTITTSVRNSIEHGNFSYDNDGNIQLIDLPNQHDKSTIKFRCSTQVNDLFSFTNQVNDNKLKENYNLKIFFQELSKIIPEDLYSEIFTRLNELSNIAFGKGLNLDYSMEKMYYEAIATVVTEVAIKKG